MTLVIDTPELQDAYDPVTNKFYTRPPKHLVFEHSLDSLTLWESKYKKPFLNSKKTNEELMDYIYMMDLTGEAEPDDLTVDVVNRVAEYIKTPQTATTITSTDSTGRRGPTMTSEVIYAYMANAQIPFTCSSWNLSRLMMLIRVIGELNKPADKKRDQQFALERNHEIMQKRRAERAAKENSK